MGDKAEMKCEVEKNKEVRLWLVADSSQGFLSRPVRDSFFHAFLLISSSSSTQ